MANAVSSLFSLECGNRVEGERGKRGDFRADVEGLNVESGNCGFVNFYMYIIAQMEWKVNYVVFLCGVC